MISRVELYYSWFSVFNDPLLPQLLSIISPKWFNHDSDLAPGDVVYFRKHQGPIKGPWSMGMVERVVKGWDLLIRQVKTLQLLRLCRCWPPTPFVHIAVHEVLALTAGTHILDVGLNVKLPGFTWVGV